MPLYVCSLPNPGEPGSPRECIADDPRVIEAFAQREDKPGRGVYDCVSPLKPGARRRALDTVGESSRCTSTSMARTSSRTWRPSTRGSPACCCRRPR